MLELKGVNKKTFTAKKWPLLSQFFQYTYITPFIRRENLSDFLIIHQNSSETCSFLYMKENVPKGQFSN